ALTRSQWVSAFFSGSLPFFSEKVKLPPEGADGSFSKGIFMKKIFKKGYLYYTPVYPLCQENHI
ncbi:hypothetical protein, partial [Ruminococcus sp.]|uniref:hypothetical protein n=1 Tax=Ruminococcus sp. TaxID=41978 RepID=UPI00307C1733